MKSIEEKGLKFDEQREDCAGLNKKFSDYHRTHNVFRDNDGFNCSGREYLRISKKEYDQVRSDGHVFQPDRRLADEWFRELLGKCPSIDSASETGVELDQSSYEEIIKPTTELREPTDKDTPSGRFKDGVYVAKTAPAVLQETQGREALSNEENPSKKGRASTNKPNGKLSNGRPKMPQGLRSSFTLNDAPKHVPATKQQKAAVDIKAVINEMRSPTDAAAAFSNLKGADDEAPTGRISNTMRFTVELLERDRNLRRRITSPTLDTGDPFDGSSLKPRATTPFPRVQASPDWTISHHFENPPQSEASEATDGDDDSASPYGTLPLTQEIETLPPAPQGNPAEPSNDEEQKTAISISNSDNHGSLVMHAMTVAESIFPGFEFFFHQGPAGAGRFGRVFAPFGRCGESGGRRIMGWWTLVFKSEGRGERVVELSVHSFVGCCEIA